ncbi:hypothetical protein R1flu_021730 [Riccia fluitans]|uniref:O-fucosyltransferase family protein n=1 Tax=Riccia fluitans TaxID=41844 RepID=A0ABD1ZRD6_9MARC
MIFLFRRRVEFLLLVSRDDAHGHSMPYDLVTNGWQKSQSVPSSVYAMFITPEAAQPMEQSSRRKRVTRRKVLRLILIVAILLSGFFLLEWRYLSSLGQNLQSKRESLNSGPTLLPRNSSQKRPSLFMFNRLLALAAHALAEGDSKIEPDDLWNEPIAEAAKWKPCAHKRKLDYAAPPEPKDSSGYIIISADGGLNQQRVAICNAVAVARLMNATLVLPRFLFNSVWKDDSQFGDIYQESYFINYLKDDVRIIKELPVELRSLDLAVLGSILTNADVPKESKPRFYLENVMPLLIRNRVIHFFEFGNSLSFDPVPPDIQRLRCRCNFHALKFVPRIQQTAGIIIRRMRDKSPRWGLVEDAVASLPPVSDIEKVLVENYAKPDSISTKSETDLAIVGEDYGARNRYLSLHMRFEIDMVAYSLCEFGGGEEEREELQAFREIHFPTLSKHYLSGKLKTAAALREEGKCPLTPEEAVLMLAAVGFKRSTRVYLAGAHVYGGEERMAILTNLYPNIVTKWDLLTAEEVAPFANHSSQMAALDFIVCSAADAFAMTDSGSQLASLVSGYRIYFGRGYLPSIRPNKRRLAVILANNATIEWEDLEERVRKTVRESKRVLVRPTARSVYRHPRCKECMCASRS